MGFGADRTERHRTCGETFDDLSSGFDLVNRNRFAGVDLELEQTTQSQMALALVIDELRIFFVGAEVVGTRAVLQLSNSIRSPHMFFATHTPCIFAAGI